MNSMFFAARRFNQPINFDTSNVEDMSLMFYENFVFVGPIGSNFNTAKVTNMDGMFARAYAFNQILSWWCVPLITQPPSDFRESGLDELKPVWGTCPN